MTICEAFKKAVKKRIEEGKTLEEIGIELCGGIEEPRRKAIRIVKMIYGEDYLIRNAGKLGYFLSQARGGETTAYKEQQFFAAENLSEVKGTVFDHEGNEVQVDEKGMYHHKNNTISPYPPILEDYPDPACEYNPENQYIICPSCGHKFKEDKK